MTRLSTSMAPPGLNGETRRIGRFGHDDTLSAAAIWANEIRAPPSNKEMSLLALGPDRRKMERMEFFRCQRAILATPRASSIGRSAQSGGHRRVAQDQPQLFLQALVDKSA